MYFAHVHINLQYTWYMYMHGLKAFYTFMIYCHDVLRQLIIIMATPTFFTPRLHKQNGRSRAFLKPNRSSRQGINQVHVASLCYLLLVTIQKDDWSVV